MFDCGKLYNREVTDMVHEASPSAAIDLCLRRAILSVFYGRL